MRSSKACAPGASPDAPSALTTYEPSTRRIAFCTTSGYGTTGPYQNMASHGIAFDVWAGVITPATDDEGFCSIPEHPSVGMNVGSLRPTRWRAMSCGEAVEGVIGGDHDRAWFADLERRCSTGQVDPDDGVVGPRDLVAPARTKVAPAGHDIEPVPNER